MLNGLQHASIANRPPNPGEFLALPLAPEHMQDSESARRPFFRVGDRGSPCSGVHIAFTAQTRAQVDEFYRAAMKAGAKSNGEPGPRPHYHENHYGAFVLDPDGSNIAAVCRKPL